MTVVSSAASQVSLPQAESASQKTDQSRADNFVALLNIGSISAENNPPPVATQETASEPLPPQAPAPRPLNKNTARSSQALPPRNTAPVAAPRKTTAASEKTQTTNTDDDNHTTATPDKTAAASNSEKTDDTTSDVAARQKKIRAQLSSQLDSISQILQAFIAALSTGQSPQTATNSAAQTATTTDGATATQPATPTLASLLESAIQTTPTADAAATATTAATASSGQIAIPATLATIDPKDEVALLKDIQSLLQQLRDNVQAVDTATVQPPPSVATTAPTDGALTVQAETPVPQQNLQALVSNIQQDVAALMQRFAQIPAGETATITITPPPASTQTTAASSDNTPALPAAIDPTKPQTILAFLKDGIAQAHDSLKALQQENEAIFAQAKTTLQEQFEAAQVNFKPIDTKTTATIATIPTAVATAALPVQTDTTTQPLAIVIALSGQDNNSNGQTSQQQTQDQGQNPTPTPVSAAQSSDTSASRSEAPSFARTITRAQNISLIDQVTQQVKAAASNGTSSLRIQLSPGDLGKMDIKLSVDSDGKTSLNILVDNKSTLDLLQRDAGTLTRTLNEAGLSADSSSLSFNLRGGQQQNQGNQQASTTYKKAQPESEEPVLLNVISRNDAVNLSDGLDIQI